VCALHQSGFSPLSQPLIEASRTQTWRRIKIFCARNAISCTLSITWLDVSEPETAIIRSKARPEELSFHCVTVCCNRSLLFNVKATHVLNGFCSDYFWHVLLKSAFLMMESSAGTTDEDIQRWDLSREKRPVLKEHLHPQILHGKTDKGVFLLLFFRSRLFGFLIECKINDVGPYDEEKSYTAPKRKRRAYLYAQNCAGSKRRCACHWPMVTMLAIYSTPVNTQGWSWKNPSGKSVVGIFEKKTFHVMFL